MSKALISQIENDKVCPSTKTLTTIAMRLDKPLVYFLDTSGHDVSVISELLEAVCRLFADGEYERAVSEGYTALELANAPVEEDITSVLKFMVGRGLYTIAPRNAMKNIRDHTDMTASALPSGIHPVSP